MVENSASQAKYHSTIGFVWQGAFGLVLLILVLGYPLGIWLMDRQGTYYYTSALADLDEDGDLDVIIHHVRRESETTAFGRTVIWTNQGGRKFTSGDLKLPELPGMWTVMRAPISSSWPLPN